VFYMRADPQLTWFGMVVTRQAPLNLVYQLLYDKELFGQCEAILSCAHLWKLQLQPHRPTPLAIPRSGAGGGGGGEREDKKRKGAAAASTHTPPSTPLAQKKDKEAAWALGVMPPPVPGDECTPLDVYVRALTQVLADETFFFAARVLAGRCLVHSLSWSSTDRYAQAASRQVFDAIKTLGHRSGGVKLARARKRSSFFPFHPTR
jgi:hypothetical protein